MKPILVVGLFVAMTLAGCTDDDGSTDPNTAGGDGSSTETVQIAKPEWQVGDWWTFDSTFGSQTIAITADNGDTWTVDTDAVSFAFFHSTFEEISYLGHIRKDDLAGSQEGTPVKYFDWPLEHGKTWTTQWDGLDFDMVAHVADERIAHIVATTDDREYSMVYDAQVGWFTEFSFMDADGTETGRMDLTDSGSGFTGELIRVDAEVVSEETYEGATDQGMGLWGELDADDADAYLNLNAACGTGQFVFAVGTVQALAETGVATGTFENQGHTIQSACPNEYGFSGVIGEAPGNGDTWGDLISSESPDLVLEYTLYLRHFERITL